MTRLRYIQSGIHKIWWMKVFRISGNENKGIFFVSIVRLWQVFLLLLEEATNHDESQRTQTQNICIFRAIVSPVFVTTRTFVIRTAVQSWTIPRPQAIHISQNFCLLSLFWRSAATPSRNDTLKIFVLDRNSFNFTCIVTWEYLNIWSRKKRKLIPAFLSRMEIIDSVYEFF